MNKRSLWLATSCVLLALIFNHAHAFSCADTATTKVPQLQCEALVTLYDSTNGDGWRNNTNWKTATPVRSWYGITATGYVLGLRLSNNQLSGTIPPELGELNLWLFLNLNNNQLSGSIPAELSNSAMLQSLDLSNNQLSGSIPTELGRLTNLHSLSLDSNQLSGTIPAELGRLTNLHSLSLDSNQLSGAIPAELGKLANLYTLYLQDNRLSGAIPAELGKLANLEYLNLHNNQLSGNILAELGKLANLEELNLYNNQLNGSIPAELGKLANLEELNLYNNQLNGSIPAELSELAKLKILNLSDNQLSGTIPAELGKLANLVLLYLNSNQLSGTIPVELGNLTNLWFLYLNSNELRGAIPAELGNLTNLQLLYLNSNQLSGTIPTELGNLAGLHVLNLHNNYLTGDSPNISLATILNQLGDFKIRNNCLTPTDPTIRNILDSKDYWWHNTQTNCQTTPFSCSTVTDIPSGECAALVKLYASTNGDNWTNNSNWQQTKKLCNWYGITCNNGHIERINLNNNQLSGALPDLALPKLTLLQLVGNSLTGPLPSFTTTPALTELNLAANQLMGKLPTPSLPNLTTLFVENNQLSGIIPSFANFPALTALDLSNNQFCADPSRDYGLWQPQADTYPQCQRTLKLIKRLEGQGKIFASDGSIDCNVECNVQEITYDTFGPAPTLTAIPTADSVFLGWRGWDKACQSKQPTTQITIDKAQLCIAEFGLKSGNILTVVKTGQGSGWVRTPLNTIYCNQSCLQDQATYAADIAVTLIALPELGSSFEEWSGDCSGTEPTISVTMEKDKNCTAKFRVTEPVPANMHTLTVQIIPNAATDSVTSTYSRGINCPEDCAENYLAGQRVNLEAFPHSESQFIGWSGECKHTASANSFVIMDGDKTCIAEFVGQ